MRTKMRAIRPSIRCLRAAIVPAQPRPQTIALPPGLRAALPLPEILPKSHAPAGTNRQILSSIARRRRHCRHTADRPPYRRGTASARTARRTPALRVKLNPLDHLNTPLSKPEKPSSPIPPTRHVTRSHVSRAMNSQDVALYTLHPCHKTAWTPKLATVQDVRPPEKPISPRGKNAPHSRRNIRLNTSI